MGVWGGGGVATGTGLGVGVVLGGVGGLWGGRWGSVTVLRSFVCRQAYLGAGAEVWALPPQAPPTPCTPAYASSRCVRLTISLRPLSIGVRTLLSNAAVEEAASAASVISSTDASRLEP